MTSHSTLFQHGALKRLRILILITTLIALTSLTSVFSVTAQDSGLGVGRGHGLEVGINLTALDQIRAEIAAGVYNRPCTPQEHDRHKWHTLIDPVLKCHYDHHHGDDPNYVNDLFGEAGSWFGVPGQSVSYPWQTFAATHAYEGNAQFVAENKMENDLKHEGYIWVVRRDQPCPEANCVTDFRLQVHAIMGAHDMPVRYHSYSFEGRVCVNPNDPSTCGLVRNAGWADFGRLFTTAADVADCGHEVQDIPIPLAADSLFFPLDRPEARDEIRCHPNLTNLPENPGRDPLAEWWAHSQGDLIRFQLRSYDPIGNVRPENPSEWHFHCEAGATDCEYNQTMMSAFIGYVLNIREFITQTPYIRTDPNNSGRANYAGWADRWGNYRADCTAANLDCVPVIYDNVPMNLDYNNNGIPEEARYFHHPCDDCERVDYDLSPAGQNWNNWFFTKYTDHTDTPPPPPAPTEPALMIKVDPASPAVGDSVIASLDLYNVTGVYGLQAECTVNPAVLTGTERIDGSGFNADNSFFVDSGFDAATGTWMVAASRLSDGSGTNAGIAGNMTAFMLSYDVIAAGDSAVNCAVLAVDADGNAIDLEIINGTLITDPGTDPGTDPQTPPPTPMPATPTPVPAGMSSLAGVTGYQNRPDNAGITVELYNLVDNSLVDTTVTAEDGSYTFSEVPLGTYSLLLKAPQHIPVVYPVDVTTDGSAVTVEPGTLQAGDVDDSGAVDILDATFVGANFGLETVPDIANVDLNLDGFINITDLVLVGGNFGLASPVSAE